MTDLIQKAKEYATSRHDARNQRYGEHPYSFHLAQVAETANRFLYLLPEDLHEIVPAGCWVHDVIEDTGESYNDVLKATCLEVAEIAFALTTPKGRTRKERHSADYYQGIRSTPGASFVKICDRIANARFSEKTESKMLAVYRREQQEFWNVLWVAEYRDMFQELEFILKVKG